MRRGLATAALGLALGAAGCGGSGIAARPSGRAVFATACSYCHSLNGHPTRRQQGGDLLGLRLSRSVALQFAREMPVQRALTRAQLSAVVDYIAQVQSGAGR